MRRIPTQIMAALVFGGVLVSCSAPAHNSYLARRPDGTLFESHAELMQYLKEHPEEAARIESQTRMTSRQLGVGDTPQAAVDPSPGSLAYLDFRNGFRDLKFGDPPTQDMRAFEESGDTKFYRRSSDDLIIGNAKIKEISYGFYKDLQEGTCDERQ
jgi:hypothetical protein